MPILRLNTIEIVPLRNRIPGISVLPFFFSALILSVAQASSAKSSGLSVTADRLNTFINESLNLTIRYNGQARSGEPDFTALENDFEIISSSRQQQYIVQNGDAKSFTDWNLTLIPLRAGTLLVPSLNYEGEVSDALEINVAEVADSENSLSKPAVFAETVVDKKTARVQEQILLTTRLFYSIPLTDFSLTPLTLPDGILEEFQDKQYTKIIDGREYGVIEKSYAIFAQASGQMNIKGQRFEAYEAASRRQFGVFNQRGKKIVRITDETTLEILDRPKDFSGDSWLPTKKLELTEIWNGDLKKLKVGEPITRSITVTADGLTGAQIHPLTIETPESYRIYPDQPKIETKTRGYNVIGVRIESMALVPSRAGRLEIPSIYVEWWNTELKTTERTVIEGRVLEIAENESRPDYVDANEKDVSVLREDETPILSAQPEPRIPQWPLIFSIIINVMLLASIITVLFIWRRSPEKKVGNSGKSDLTIANRLNTISNAAKNKDPIGMRQAIIEWGQTLLEDPSPLTLSSLAAKLGNDSLKTHFKLLDSQLYGKQDEQFLDQEELIREIKRESALSAKKKDLEDRLQPLYPT